MGEIVWRKPCEGGACVEVGRDGDDFYLRDSANPGVMLGPYDRRHIADLAATGVEMATFSKALV